VPLTPANMTKKLLAILLLLQLCFVSFKSANDKNSHIACPFVGRAQLKIVSCQARAVVRVPGNIIFFHAESMAPPPTLRLLRVRALITRLLTSGGGVPPPASCSPGRGSLAGHALMSCSRCCRLATVSRPDLTLTRLAS
jgi:hypothetical protein